MTQNQQFLMEAQAQVKEFEAKQEPESLSLAYQALENVTWVSEDNLEVRARLRTDSLLLWLEMLRLLDRLLEPDFDSADMPEKFVEPPPVPGGVVLRPGADPAGIKDPKVRAEYEQAIAANRTKAERYRLQTLLRRLDERIAPRVDSFITQAYASSPDDDKEARTTIDKVIDDAGRKAHLLELLK